MALEIMQNFARDITRAVDIFFAGVVFAELIFLFNFLV